VTTDAVADPKCGFARVSGYGSVRRQNTRDSLCRGMWTLPGFECPAGVTLVTYGPLIHVTDEVYDNPGFGWRDYGLTFPDGMRVPATPIESCRHWGPFVNTAADELGQKNNLEYVLGPLENPSVGLRSTRPIGPNEELLVCYGPQFNELLKKKRQEWQQAVTDQRQSNWRTKTSWQCAKCYARFNKNKMRTHALTCKLGSS